MGAPEPGGLMGAGLAGEESLPTAESGLGGAIVPNRIDAR